MKKYSITILFFFLLSFNLFSQFGCNNENFENGSLTNPVPSTIVVSTPNTVNGWLITSGTNTGTVTSCNIYSCCPNSPNSAQVIGTTSLSGMIDPNIGPSYPISSYFELYSPVFSSTNTPNSGGGSGLWFGKLNDDMPNAGIQRIKKTMTVTPYNAILIYSVLPVIQNSSHSCCNQPSIQGWLRNATPCFASSIIIPGSQLSIYSSTTCSSSLGGFITCPANPLFSYSPWRTFGFDLSSYIGNCIEFELAVTDCSFGDHAVYAYFDAQCIPYDFCTCLYYANTSPGIFSTCGLSSSPASVPPQLGPFLWNGPAGWPDNGATTNTVNLTLPGVYTVSCNPMGVTTPIIRTFTVVNTPPASAALTLSQSTACVGGNTIALTGSPSGGVYSGSFVTGNNFSPASIGNYSVSYTYTDSNGCSDTATKTINVVSCTGITENDVFANSIDLYPQPAKDLVNVSLNYFYEPTLEIRITDVNGKTVCSSELAVRNGKTQIETSELSGGVYVLQFISRNQVAQKRLIIAK